jgi:hypothetical protein
MFALTACGGPSLEDYQSSLADVLTELDDALENETAVDYSDPEAAGTFVTKMKGLYTRLAELKPAKDAADAQEQIAQGAAKMQEYLDALPDYLALPPGTPEEVQENTRLALLDTYSQATKAINAGVELARGLAGPAETETESGETEPEDEADSGEANTGEADS